MKLTAIDWCYPVIKRRMILYNGYKVSSNKSQFNSIKRGYFDNCIGKLSKENIEPTRVKEKKIELQG